MNHVFLQCYNTPVSTHPPVIIPEINNSNAICDYLAQTSKVLSGKQFPTYVFFVNFPQKIFKKPLVTLNSHLIHCYPIQLIPFNRFRLIQQLNLHLSFNLLYLFILFRHLSRPIYWFFYPQLISLIRFSFKPTKIVYDIVDSYLCPNNLKKYLLQKSTVVTAISHPLITEYQKFSPNTKIHLVPQGFNLIKSTSPFAPLLQLRHLTHKIGFIGGINNRLEYDLLFKVITANPNYNFIFAGPAGTDINVSSKPVDTLNRQLFSYPNVCHLGLVPKDQIQNVVNFFDIAIIPYDIRDQFNLLCYPMKIFEYFACQKPVVSTPIEELKQFPQLVKIGNTVSEWQKHLDYFFSRPTTPSQKKRSVSLAHQNSWNHKVEKILKLLSL